MTDSFRHNLEDQAHNAAETAKAGAERAEEAVTEGTGRVREGLRRTRDSVEGVGRRAGTAASDSIDYFRESGFRGVVSDLEDVVKKHPGQSLFAVAAVGFALGMTLRRRD